MPLLTRRYWTRDEVLAIPEDGQCYELVDGELLVSPSPRRVHQIASSVLNALIRFYATSNRIGSTTGAPADIDLQSGQLVQPDLYVTESVPGRPAREWEDVGIPLLVVEILSRSTGDYDRGIKRRLYQRSGVPVYWIVDLDAWKVEIWAPGSRSPRVVRDRLVWQPDAKVDPLVIDLPDFFRGVWEE